MTPQELLDREGFIPLAGNRPWKIGEIVNPSGSIVGGCTMVIVGTMSREEVLGFCDRNGVWIPQTEFYYKAIAE